MNSLPCGGVPRHLRQRPSRLQPAHISPGKVNKCANDALCHQKNVAVVKFLSSILPLAIRSVVCRTLSLLPRPHWPSHRMGSLFSKQGRYVRFSRSCRSKSHALCSYNPPNETLEEFIDRGDCALSFPCIIPCVMRIQARRIVGRRRSRWPACSYARM